MGIKKIIAIASAKGGVGKSTICAHLATQFSNDHKVGILDADIYGPNQHIIFNVSDLKPEIKTYNGAKSFIPIQVNGIALNSMGFVLDKDKAAFIHIGDITGMQPAINNSLAGFFRHFIIALHDQIAGKYQLAFNTGWQ